MLNTEGVAQSGNGSSGDVGGNDKGRKGDGGKKVGGTTESEYWLCAGCLGKTKAVVFNPCGHYFFCGPCAQKMSVCPYCFEDITTKGPVPSILSRVFHSRSTNLKFRNLCYRVEFIVSQYVYGRF